MLMYSIVMFVYSYCYLYVFLLSRFIYFYCYVYVFYCYFYIFLLSCFMYFYCYVYVFLLLCMFCSVYSVFIMPNWHSSPTLTEVFPCFFLSCKANVRV